MIKPNALKKGDTIGIVSPSYWADEDVLHTVKTYYEDRGFHIQFGRSPFLRNNKYAGTPEDRANDIMAMFTNDEIDAIVCARGGYGANRVLPLLDYDVIRNNPKIFMGYSDITALIHSLNQQADLLAFHGPMLVTYKKEFIPYNWEIFESVVSGDKNLIFRNPDDMKSNTLKEGSASAPLSGGNLCLVVNRLGTPGQVNFDDTILFLEDIGEQLYAFDRYLVQLRASGTVDGIKGLIIGELEDMEDSGVPFGKTTDEIILDVFGDLDIPIVTNVACGHGKYQMTLPVGHPIKLDIEPDSFSIQITGSPVTK